MHNKFLKTEKKGYNPLKKIKITIKGIRFGVLSDFSVAYKFFLSVILLGLTAYFHDWVDVMVILVATAQVLSAELFNTSIEAVCDFIETEENYKIMFIKDVAAGATGISIGAWVIIVIYEFYKLRLHF